MLTVISPDLVFPSDAFTMVVDTTQAGSASDTFIIPLPGSGTYDFDVDWGDGSTNNYTQNTDVTKVYSTGGEYTIKITGTFPRIYFNNGGDKAKLKDVSNWGTIAWGSMEGAFRGCSNATFTASDVPDFSSVTDMSNMFSGCSSFNQSVSNFDTSNVTTMAGIFAGASNFNQSVSNFDTSNVTNMESMFNGCISFNQSVANFDTSNVTTMYAMFYNTPNFNQSLANFDTSKVTSMAQMFQFSSNFNQDVSHFDITSLTTAALMFSGSAFSNSNYDLLLVAWEAQVEKTGVTFHAGSAQYSAGAPATARNVLVTTSTWSITDGGPA